MAALPTLAPGTDPAPAADVVPGGTRVRDRFLRNRFAVAGLVFIVLMVAVAILAPVLAPADPDAQDLLNTLQPPSSEHLLGTDLFGRDVLSRTIHGARISLLAGAIALGVAVVLGVPLGLLAGFQRGPVDRVLTVINDSFLSVPALVLAVAVVAALGKGMVNAMVAIGLVMMPRFYRLTRAATKSIMEEPYIRAAISVGCTRRQVLFGHVLPNVASPLIVQGSLVLGTSILSEASLSFLGLGTRPPTASWGSMLGEASDSLSDPYLLWGPATAITLTVVAFAAVGDGLRDAMMTSRTSGR